MAIRANIGLATTDLAAVSTDTVVFNQASRCSITGASLHNTLSAGDREVFFYESPNLTSASGKRIGVYTVAPGARTDVSSIIGQGYNSDQNIIAVQQTGASALGDLNIKISYIEYTGGD